MDVVLRAALAGNGPDVVIGLNQSTAQDFAMRGATVKLSDYADFAEYVSRYSQGVMRATEYNGGSYGIPEQVSFQMLFYREDVMAELGITDPQNLEEQALSLVGTDVYTKLVKGYTEKQWGRDCTELPAFIIKRLPCRFIYDNNYFNDRYQGIPMGGYTAMVEKMLEGVEVRLNCDFFELIKQQPDIAQTIVYTGCIDEYFGYKLGALQYRSVRFETEELPEENFQGNAVVNYTEREVPYTRIIEHKHFEFGKQPTTIISREYSAERKPGMEPYYPVNNDENAALYEQYKELAAQQGNVIFGGRLGQYRYYDMDKVIRAALDDLKNL
jgi:UDP-galactopyranose mutase